jgi:hypothetical protein
MKLQASAKPAPKGLSVMNAGGYSIIPIKRLTLATPQESSKRRNIGSSFGESPKKAVARVDNIGSHPRTLERKNSDIESLS